jgi:hypothetical protein
LVNKDAGGIASETPVRLYFVKNENGFLISLRETELDEPAKLSRIGSAKEVIYKGKRLPVETTVVMVGERTSTIDRYMPSGEDN